MIHVIASIDLREGQRNAFLREFHEVMPKVHAESGCIEYGATVDLPTNIPVQSPVRADSVTIIEKWSDLPALEAHLKAPHMMEYRVKVKEFVASVRLQILQPA